VSALDPDEEFALSKALRRVGWIVGYENLGCIPEEAILVFIEVGLPIEDAPRLIAAYGDDAAVADFFAGLVEGVGDGGHAEWLLLLLDDDFDPADAYGHYIDDLLSIARGAVVRDAGRPERGET
jgi:hypothetical protein